MKKYIKIFDLTLSIICACVLSATFLYSSILPDNIQVYSESDLKFSKAVLVQLEKKKVVDSVSEISDSVVNSNYNSKAKLFGFIPIKTINVKKIDKMKVIVSGESFGIKIFMKGVMVVGLSAVDTSVGSINPAKDVGLKLGDNILEINGQEVSSNEDVSRIIRASQGKKQKLLVNRNAVLKTYYLTPVYSVSDKNYKAGMWVRDSSAGIGTLTFYSPVSGGFAGLGHAVTDVDTGLLLPLSSGEIVKTKILSVNKSEIGQAGEICGIFTEETIGKLIDNDRTGLYGSLYDFDSQKRLMTISLKQEVKTGKAKILTTLDNDKPKYYDCVIEKTDYSANNMVISITDKELLDITGGIVQGMSGSPIIQNGKLVGAVTHVFVNSPTKGYANFAEDMYNVLCENDLLKIS